MLGLQGERMKYVFFLIGSNKSKLNLYQAKPHIHTIIIVYGVFHVQGLLIFYNNKKLDPEGQHKKLSHKGQHI
jgi:hypothetical protein